MTAVYGFLCVVLGIWTGAAIARERWVQAVVYLVLYIILALAFGGSMGGADG